MKKPSLTTCRRTLQIGVAIAFIIIPWLNHLRISIVYGNFLSFHFLKLPLADPLAVLQIMLKNSYFCLDLIIGAIIALLLAATLGTVFCSWICPFGLLSEWGQTLSKRWQSKGKTAGDQAHQRGFKVKLVLFAAGLIGFLLFSTTPVLNQLSLPAWYSRIFQFWFEQWHVSLAILVLLGIICVEAFYGNRLWCRYICPQSVLLQLAKQANPKRLKVHFHPQACICKSRYSDPCVQACSLNLDPKALAMFPETECTNCGDCVVACSRRGRALTFRRR